MRIPTLVRRIIRIAVLPAATLTAGVLIGAAVVPAPFPVSVPVGVPAPVTSTTVAVQWIEPLNPVPADVVCVGGDLPVTLYSRAGGVTEQQNLCLPGELSATRLSAQTAWVLTR